MKGLLVGAILGVLAWGGARFALVPPLAGVHHHANMTIYIDGERLDLSLDRYMEDIAACSADPNSVAPADRVHLHNNEDQVVHVHHAGATWGHLFANLDLGLGHGYLITDEGRRFFDGEEGRAIKFVLNGRGERDVHNLAIRSADRLLVSVGAESFEEAMAIQYPTVPEDAVRYNETSDPAGCAGAHMELSVGQRLKYAFWGA